MIDPQWDVSDLDPITWRNIGRYLPPGQYMRAGNPDEHALYVLHQAGVVLNVIDTVSGRRTDLGINLVSDPATLAGDLHQRGEWDRVHIVDKAHLVAVSHEVQSDARSELTLDAYYRFAYQQYWDGEGGYVTAPARATTWNHWTWSGVQAWIAALPSPASIGLGVVGNDGLEIGVLLGVSDGLIRRVTTFEALRVPRSAAAVSAAYLDAIWTGMEVIAPPAALLICTPDAFEAWLTGPHKQSAIDAAVATGRAFVRFSTRWCAPES